MMWWGRRFLVGSGRGLSNIHIHMLKWMKKTTILLRNNAKHQKWFRWMTQHHRESVIVCFACNETCLHCALKCFPFVLQLLLLLLLRPTEACITTAVWKSFALWDSRISTKEKTSGYKNSSQFPHYIIYHMLFSEGYCIEVHNIIN